jgi:hypothetical protein
MGDAPIAFIEGAGGERVAEDAIVAVGKHDVSPACFFFDQANGSIRYFHSKLLERRYFKLGGGGVCFGA